MKYHPDKVSENDKIEATEKFKIISRIHALLSDAEKRKLYDDTGKMVIILYNLILILYDWSAEENFSAS